ncbi:MAG: hypothetical protein JMN27_04350 [gamma proteobacterium endosymbiont of Lamellibrachia anaximandri]|nr:hypothetical protein [gamma proteobacterium endosymbiont of Lamellibrachia anaximandri]MBL3533044.1 hypothetical protein [gamma proteobacterium endosymbiont of Lamellibrachia anaximandri]
MDIDGHEFIKHRSIHFVELHPDPNQAQTAALLLADVEGVMRVGPVDARHLQVTYHIMDITLEQIEVGLTSMGLHIDNRLLYRLMRALHYYTEENQRAVRGCTKGNPNCTRNIFAKRYQSIDHHCRDHRPEHWRKYL